MILCKDDDNNNFQAVWIEFAHIQGKTMII